MLPDIHFSAPPIAKINRKKVENVTLQNGFFTNQNMKLQGLLYILSINFIFRVNIQNISKIFHVFHISKISGECTFFGH